MKVFTTDSGQQTAIPSMKDIATLSAAASILKTVAIIEPGTSAGMAAAEGSSAICDVLAMFHGEDEPLEMIAPA